MPIITKSRVIIVLIIIIFSSILSYRIYDFLNPQIIEEQIKIKPVRTINSSDYQIKESKISAGGQVTSAQENEIRAELGAKLLQLFVRTGDQVNTGQIIAQLDSSTVDIQLAQASATIERIRAQRDQQAGGARNETVQSALATLDRARIAVLQSGQQLEQVKINSEDAERRSLSTIEKINNAINENNRLTIEATKSAYDNLETSVKNAITAIDSSLLTMGNMLGEAPGSELANNDFENVFGAKSQALRENFKLNFIDFRERFELFRIKFNNISNFFSPDSLTDFSLDIDKQLKLIGELLEQNRLNLENTFTQGGFDDRALTALKTQINAAITGNNGQINALSSARQRIRDIQIKSENTAESLYLDLTKAKKDLESIIIQNAKSIEIAQKAVQIQETAVKQTELSVQELESGPRNIDLAALNAAIKEAEAAYYLISKNREKATIKAGFSGTIADLPFQVGEFVSPGQIVATLINSDQIEIKAYISNSDRELINNDSGIIINGGISGKIDFISPRIDPQKKKIEVRIFPDQTGNLHIGEFVEVIFENKIPAEKNSFFLPFKAIKNTPDGAFILIVNNEGKIVSRKITLGRIISDHIEVISGLEVNQEIIESTRGLNDGDSVEIFNSSKVKVVL